MSVGGEKYDLWMSVMHQEACSMMANGDSRRQTLSYTGCRISTFKNGLKTF